MRVVLAFLLTLTLSACATLGGNPVVGTWDTTVVTPRGENNSVLTLNEDMTGTITGTRGAVMDLENVMFEGGQLSFTMTLNVQG